MSFPAKKKKREGPWLSTRREREERQGRNPKEKAAAGFTDFLLSSSCLALNLAAVSIGPGPEKTKKKNELAKIKYWSEGERGF